MFRDVKVYKFSIGFNEKLIYHKEFRNLDDFSLSILSEDINPIFSSTKSSSSASFDFTGTNSFKEAWNLCRFTMDEGFERFYNLYSNLNRIFTNNLKKNTVFSPVGFNPNIPRYLKGVPTNMHNYRMEYSEQIVSIYINTSYSSFQNHNEIINRGVLILNLVNYLENQGIKVNLSLCDLSMKDNEIVLMDIPLKNVNEKLNIKKCYFPLVHPSFLRRLCFKGLELMPVANPRWSYGYGLPLEYKDAVEILNQLKKRKMAKKEFSTDEIIYISTPKELGINGEDIYKDCENFIKIVNDKYKFVDDLEKNKRR